MDPTDRLHITLAEDEAETRDSFLVGTARAVPFPAGGGAP
jgi:hypothetical protein